MNHRIMSLCSGIGGLELGLERAGLGHTVCQVEREPFCQKVLRKHWPGASLFDDVTTAHEKELPHASLVCFGFPCQDLSVAGKQAGLEGERSGLFWSCMRIVRQVRPEWVVIENVTALLTAQGAPVPPEWWPVGDGPAPAFRSAFGAVLWALAESGFDAVWDCIPCSALGAPHQRDRVFMVAHAQRQRVRQQPEPERWSEGATFAPYDGQEGPVANPNGEHPVCHPDRKGLAVGQVFGGDARSQLQATQRASRGGGGVWDERLPESEVGGLADGLSRRLVRAWERGEPRTVADRGQPGTWERWCWVGALKGYGNAVSPVVGEFIGRRILAAEGRA